MNDIYEVLFRISLVTFTLVDLERLLFPGSYIRRGVGRFKLLLLLDRVYGSGTARPAGPVFE